MAMCTVYKWMKTIPYEPIEQEARTAVGFTHLDGVILVRSSPIVLMTRRPQIHSPNEMPTPP